MTISPTIDTYPVTQSTFCDDVRTQVWTWAIHHGYRVANVSQGVVFFELRNDFQHLGGIDLKTKALAHVRAQSLALHPSGRWEFFLHGSDTGFGTQGLALTCQNL